LELGKFEEAQRHYEHILALPMGDEAIYVLGKARAEFGLGHAAETVATLDRLRARWPEYQSAEGHLLYARALEESGRTEEALFEYQPLLTIFPAPKHACATLFCSTKRVSMPRPRPSLRRSWRGISASPNMCGGCSRNGSRALKRRFETGLRVESKFFDISC
jgi:tetratricopeptide (TPR) repeat protein